MHGTENTTSEPDVRHHQRKIDIHATQALIDQLATTGCQVTASTPISRVVPSQAINKHFKRFLMRRPEQWHKNPDSAPGFGNRSVHEEHQVCICFG
mmetsp:Transcript_92407/g.178105  ORF Transcript_92407/g.178105 Transcript_92407/m.178105 type:complete len:96 (+) Transcript_92407:56-343(+)